MVDTPRTIRSFVAATKPWLEKKGVDNARLDAELLVAHALGVKRIELFMDLDRPLSDDEIAGVRELVRRRGQREPIALILGAREFFGLSFIVTKDVLVPRPETEHLVELALARTAADEDALFVDVCTGSGCVALAILAHRPKQRAIATDVSPKALAVARDNASKLGVADRVDFREGDLLQPLAGDAGDVAFIVGNPPYIRADERASLAPEVRDHEPSLALFGEGDDGLGHHRRILEQARPVNARFVALEIGAGQGDACRALGAVVHKDLAGLERVAVFERPSQ